MCVTMNVMHISTIPVVRVRELANGLEGGVDGDGE